MDLTKEWTDAIKESSQILIDKFQDKFTRFYKEEIEAQEAQKARILVDLDSVKLLYTNESTALNNLILEQRKVEASLNYLKEEEQRISNLIREKEDIIKESDEKLKKLTLDTMNLSAKEKSIEERELVLLAREAYIADREETIKRMTDRLGIK